VLCLALLAVPAAIVAEDRPELGEEISVTATRAPRRTRDVPQAIAVVGKDVIDDKVVFNVKDVVTGTPGVLIESKNGGYDARLIIRGAGLKASYGVREIMLLRDGVPLTDPDSFSRLDWVDTQDIERIEIAKGPGNLFSPGTAGGAIQIISRSVFDPSSDAVQVGAGTFGSYDAHLRKSVSSGSQALAVTASYRRQENDWRAWNEFQTVQVSLKHGARLGAGTLESEVAFTQADTQLPGSMDEALFAEFKRTGEQKGTSEPWRNSGRYSKIVFVNTKLELPVGALTLKPRVYYNQWTHLHPVTGAINQTEDWDRTLGTDLEAVHRHGLGGAAQGTLVAGVTAKGTWNDDSRKYQYADYSFDAAAGTTITHSDRKGALMETDSSRFVLGGVFLQESVQWGRVTVDAGGRLDRSWMRVRTDEITQYDYTTGRYTRGDGVNVTSKRFDLPAPKLGISVRATDALSVYASAAQAGQVPSESEVLSNPDLSPATSTNYEVGVKVRGAWVTADASAYYNPVKDEIVLVRDPSGVTNYQNAGETRKLGAEASTAVRIPGGLEVGGSYAYSDYTYVRFQERVRNALVSRDHNRLPYVPIHQYAAFATWRHPVGLRLRVQTSTWGRYWEDSANTAKYRGYTFLTGAGAAFQRGRHELLVDVQNVLDQRYAVSVTKDTSNKVLYTAGAPRTFFASYRFAL
jgi:iron complex outermembrane receptor protein